MNLTEFWNLKINIIQFLIALSIVELPNFYRKLKKFYYIPIYFSIFPLRELNQNLSLYLAEDYFVCIGIDLSAEEISKMKKRIIIDSAISMLISAIIIPVISGFLFAFLFDSANVFSIIILILIYKSYYIFKIMQLVRIRTFFYLQ